jgi:alkylation response protein AidB-like acyl-CoA dehydrogenase
MFVDLTPEQLELRAYFAGLISAGEREAMLTERHGTVYREIVRRMGRDGWLGVGWPAEFGGRGLGQVEQQIFVSEAARADVPLPAVTLQTVGPTLQAHGTAEQKGFFLPKILAGEVHFAIGYSPDGRPLLSKPDVRRALAETYACLRINELLNWQVAVAPTVEVADASATKVFSSERLQRLGQLLEDVVGRHGDPADEDTAELLRWLDIQAKRNTVLTFGGGVNEIQRELIATAGLGLPRVPR